MTARVLVRRFVILRALRWLPLGLGLPFFILLPLDRGLSLGAIGALWAVHGAIVFLLEVPSGALADTIGRKTTLLAGGLATVAGMAGVGISTGFAGFVAAIAAIGLGRALMSGCLEAWFVDELRTLDPAASLRGPLAAGGTAEGIGSASGALIGGLLPLAAGGLPHTGHATIIQLSVPMLAGAVAALGFVAVAGVYVEEPRRRRAGQGWRSAVTGAVATTREGLGMARHTRNVRLLLGVAGAIGVAMAGTELLWQPSLEELLGTTDAAGSAPLFGTLAAVGLLAYSAGSALSTRVARHAGARRTYAGAFVLLAVALTLIAAAPVTLVFCAAYLGYFCSLGLADPLHYEILHEAVGSSTRATVLSAESLVGQFCGIGSNLGIGPLAAVAGAGIAWGVLAVVALGAAGLAAATRLVPAVARPLRRPAAPSGAA